jgi:hypothetical protein
LPAEKKITSKIISTNSATNYKFSYGWDKRKFKSMLSPDRSFIAAEKFPDLFWALSPTATRPLKKNFSII